ncbi:MAG: hypothetical protein AAF004_08410 [Pseudomonadota bacterium]
MFGLESIVKQGLSTNNIKAIVEGLENALSSRDCEEHELAWAIGAVFENNLIDAFKFIPVFIDKYPQSLHPVRVFYADLLPRQGQYDSATDEARFYLRLLSESKLIDDLEGKALLLDGFCRAWLLLSSVYTEVGARSYSKRIINTGLNYPLPSTWIETFKKELSQLDVELKSDELKVIDDKWEDFFKSADDWSFVDNLCEQKNFPSLRKRIELIKDNFKFNPSFNLSDELLKVVQRDKNAFVLV